jgi:tetratricopeptide (TPR) repeat protein
MRSLPGILFVLYASAAFGQEKPQLAGVITYQNSNNTPVFPAQVKSRGASDASTASDGSFTLTYDRRSGEDVTLEVIKPGYEVVNKDDCSARLPDPDNKKILRLYMCRIGEWEENAMHYYRINQEVILRAYKVRINNLKGELAQARITILAYQQDSIRLQNETDRSIAYAYNLAQENARIDLDYSTARYRRAFRLFTEGKMDSMQMVLNESDIQADVDLSHAHLDNAVKEYLLKAHGYIATLHWADAERILKIAFEKAPDDERVAQELGPFLEDQNKHEEAEKYYAIWLKNARTSGNKVDYASALTDNGRFYRGSRPDTAYKLFDAALAVWNELITSDPNKFLYRYGRALCLQNYADLLDDLGATRKSLNCNQEQLDFHRSYPDRPDSATYRRQLARLYDQIGINYQHLHLLDSSYYYHQKAIAICDRLQLPKDPISIIQIAFIYMNYGNFLYLHLDSTFKIKHADSLAVKNYFKAIDIMEKNSYLNQRLFEPQLALLYTNAAMAEDVFDTSVSAIYYTKAADTYESLAKKYPDRYLQRFQDALGKRSWKRVYPLLFIVKIVSDEPADKRSAHQGRFYDQIMDFMDMTQENVQRFHSVLAVAGLPDTIRAEGLDWVLDQVHDLMLTYNSLENSPRYHLGQYRYYALKEQLAVTGKAMTALALSSILELDSLDLPDNLKMPVEATSYGNLSWGLLLDRRFKAAEDAARKGLELDNRKQWIEINLAHALLLQGKVDEAEHIYTTYKDNLSTAGKKFSDVILDDLTEMEQAGIHDPNFDAVRKLVSP